MRNADADLNRRIRALADQDVMVILDFMRAGGLDRQPETPVAPHRTTPGEEPRPKS